MDNLVKIELRERIAELETQLAEAQAKVAVAEEALAQERHTTKTLANEIMRWMRSLDGTNKRIDRMAESMHSTLNQLSYEDLRASGGLPEAQAIDAAREKADD